MFLQDPPVTKEAGEMYAKDNAEDGYVANLTRLWAWRCDVFAAFTELRSMLMTKSTLSKRELAVLVCATAGTLRDSYCSIAWGARLAALADGTPAAGVLTGRDVATLSDRERALAHWARRVASSPNDTAAEDVQSLRSAGLTDKEVFEATTFIAFRLAFSTVNDALGAAPDIQLRREAPDAVRNAVTFGRDAE